MSMLSVLFFADTLSMNILRLLNEITQVALWFQIAAAY